jgi:prevent-host-death family protein
MDWLVQIVRFVLYSILPQHGAALRRSQLPVSVARGSFADLVNEVFAFGERIVLIRHGKPVAAIVSVADLERLEASDSQPPPA